MEDMSGGNNSSNTDDNDNYGKNESLWNEN